MKLTSTSSPLRIAECPGLPLLGLTLCPGKKTHGLSGDWDRDLETDVAVIRDWGAHLVVTLMEDWELEACQVPHLGEAVRQAGMIWWHLPVLDGSPLELRKERPGKDSLTLLCALMRTLMALGRKVLVHCRGGLGRTGTLAARLLIEEGFHAEEALKRVRSVRPGAVETDEQEGWLYWIEEALMSSKPRRLARACLLGGALGEAVGEDVVRTPALNENRAARLGESFPGDRLEIGACTQLSLFTGDALLRAGCLPDVKVPKMPRQIRRIVLSQCRELRHFRDFDADFVAAVRGRLRVAEARAAWDELASRLDGDSSLAFFRKLKTRDCALYLATRDWRSLQGDLPPVDNGSLPLLARDLWPRRTPDVVTLASLADPVLHPLNTDGGSGALGRAAPLGLFSPLAEVEAYTRGYEASALSHRGRHALMAAGFWAALVHGLFNGVECRKAIGVAATINNSRHPNASFEPLRPLYRQMESKNPLCVPDELCHSRLAVNTVQIALTCSLVQDGFETGVVLAASRSNPVAGLLTGQLMAMLGAEIPSSWLEVLELRELITAQADALAALSSASPRARRLAAELWPAMDFEGLRDLFKFEPYERFHGYVDPGYVVGCLAMQFEKKFEIWSSHETH